MAFLRRKDYDTLIQLDNLDVVISSDATIRTEGELAATAEMQSYLRHRYDVAKIFITLAVYDNTVAYAEGDLVAYATIDDDLYSANQATTAGENPVSTPAKWDKGDTRDQLIKMHLIDLTLYHLHSRINPRNIPELRLTRRDEAIAWLKMVNKGELTTGLPVLASPTDAGLKIRWGSVEKFDNNIY